jgi:hypothetical protein
MKQSRIPLLAILALLFFASCKKEQPVISTSATNDASLLLREDCTPTTWNLMVGQTIDAGSVTVSNDATNLYVTYQLDYPNACFGQLQVWIGRDFADLPRNNKGIIVPGQFPYKSDATGQTSYTFTVPLNDFAAACGDDVYIVAHAEVDMDCNPETLGHQTGFGGNIPGDGPRWWYYGIYNVCCSTGEPDCDGETGFGGNAAGAGKAWWYYFDTQGAACQNIFAGQMLMDGGSICYDATSGMFTVTLGAGWSLDPNTTESVKAQGYSTPPTSRPQAGLFTLYKGTSLTFQGDGSRYYVVHLDLLHCE